jgi:Uma2 family endonuclease
MVVQVRRYTVEEFDELVRQSGNTDRLLEYIGGEIFEAVSNPLSSKTAVRFSTFIGIHLLEHDIGHLTGADGGYTVSGERYIPDVAFISYEKQPVLSYEDGYVPNPPDLAIEVLSPSNDDDKMRIKVTNYLAAGTIVWVADPQEKVVEVYVPGQPVKVLGLDGILDGGEVLPGFTLAVKDIFPPEGGVVSTGT